MGFLSGVAARYVSRAAAGMARAGGGIRPGAEDVRPAAPSRLWQADSDEASGSFTLG